MFSKQIKRGLLSIYPILEPKIQAWTLFCSGIMILQYICKQIDTPRVSSEYLQSGGYSWLNFVLLYRILQLQEIWHSGFRGGGGTLTAALCCANTSCFDDFPTIYYDQQDLWKKEKIFCDTLPFKLDYFYIVDFHSALTFLDKDLQSLESWELLIEMLNQFSMVKWFGWSELG